MRSARVSPMPIKMPVVNGTLSMPAASMAASRNAGALSGEPWCGPPRLASRGDTFSSIMPWDTDTWRSAAMSASLITPGLTWGRSPVSRSTSADIAAR